MRINSISSYNVNSNYDQMPKSNKAPAFKASLSPKVVDLVSPEIAGRNLSSKYYEFCEKLFSWGSPKSVINAFDSLRNPKNFTLGLDNFSISKLYGGNMGETAKPSLLDTLLGLTKENILKGEQDLRNILQERKDVVLKKAVMDDKVYNRIMEFNKSRKPLIEAINNLPEDELVDLYFYGNKIDPVQYNRVYKDLVNYLSQKDPDVFNPKVQKYLLGSNS